MERELSLTGCYSHNSNFVTVTPVTKGVPPESEVVYRSELSARSKSSSLGDRTIKILRRPPMGAAPCKEPKSETCGRHVGLLP